MDQQPLQFLTVLSSVVVGILVICGLIYFGCVTYYLTIGRKSKMAELIRTNGVQTLGLPFSALGSFALVISLPAATGDPLKFTGLGIEFDGSSSQIVLWNLTFLVFNLSIWLNRKRSGETRQPESRQSQDMGVEAAGESS